MLNYYWQQVYTVDPKNETAIREVVRMVLSMRNMSSFLPYEFSQKGMLERIGLYVLHQNFCDGENIAIGKKGKEICIVDPISIFGVTIYTQQLQVPILVITVHSRPLMAW